MTRLREEEFIGWVRRRTPRDDRSVIVGIGDDAAVVRTGPRTVLKTDMVVENVHFTRRDSRPEDWGYKAAAANLSDLAAMGAEPRYALAAVGFPPDLGSKGARAIHRGIEKALARARVRLVGGDTCRSERVTVAIFLAGTLERGKMILRSGARPGDAFFVTGRLGGSSASGRHLRFVPRLKESRFLRSRYRVRAMMDLSDGLACDLRRMGRSSGVGAEVDARCVPVHSDAGGRGVPAALCDGEDFELLFALAPKEAARLERDRTARSRGFTFYRIGTAVPAKQGFTLIHADGTRRRFPAAPDHHFGA